MPVATDPRLTANTTPDSPLSTTGTHLDGIVDALAVDAGLAANIPATQIAAGLAAADGIDRLIADGIAALHLLEDGRIDVADVVALNGWIRGDADRLALFTALHGNDEDGQETGYHLVKGDGAVALAFHQSLADTVADGIYHIGFVIQDGQFLNEDGNPNAAVQTVADQLDYYLSDLSTTGTGLDIIVDIAKADPGLSRLTLAANLQAGAIAADRLNHMIVDGLAATHGAEDGRIDAADVLAVNAWIRGDADRLALFTALHGDDAEGVETGFHLIKGDGADSTYLGLNLIDRIADSLYHIGFAVEGNRFLNEDGNLNATLGEVATTLNHLLLGIADWEGTASGDVINVSEALSLVHAGAGDDSIHGDSGADTILGEAGNDYADGGAGNDSLDGGAGDNLLFGSGGDDTIAGGDGRGRLFGGEGKDSILGGASGDMLRGEAGDDTILAGGGNDDVNGGDGNDLLDAGSGNNVLDGAAGRDTLIGGAGDDMLFGSAGDDRLDGGTAGWDRLWGGDGNDTIAGLGNGATIWGEGGDDLILTRASGGGGAWLTGGGGADTFRFEFALQATPALAATHLAAHGSVDWAGVAADPAAATGAWLLQLGRAWVFDFSQAEGDRIEVSGAGLSVLSVSAWTMADGHSNTTVTLGAAFGGGAVQAVGEIVVLGDAITAADIRVDGTVHGAQIGAQIGATAEPGFDAYAQAWTQPGGWAFA